LRGKTAARIPVKRKTSDILDKTSNKGRGKFCHWWGEWSNRKKAALSKSNFRRGETRKEALPQKGYG